MKNCIQFTTTKLEAKKIKAANEIMCLDVT